MNIFEWSVNGPRPQQGTDRKLHFMCNSWQCVETTKTDSCALLDYYAACGRNSLVTFRFNLSVPSSGILDPWMKCIYSLEADSCLSNKITLILRNDKSNYRTTTNQHFAPNNCSMHSVLYFLYFHFNIIFSTLRFSIFPRNFSLELMN